MELVDSKVLNYKLKYFPLTSSFLTLYENTCCILVNVNTIMNFMSYDNVIDGTPLRPLRLLAIETLYDQLPVARRDDYIISV